jgi:heme-binding NEAT domain protein
MPCVCYGAVSGNEELDKFRETEDGKEVYRDILHAAFLIKNASIDIECERNEFNSAWIKCFDHMLNGCDEDKQNMLQMTKTFTITMRDLMDILREYDEDEFEAKPLNALSFCKYIFHKYKNS